MRAQVIISILGRDVRKINTFEAWLSRTESLTEANKKTKRKAVVDGGSRTSRFESLTSAITVSKAAAQGLSFFTRMLR